MTEREKMTAGKLYDPADDELFEMRARAHGLCQKYNATFETEAEAREKLLDELVPERGEHAFLQGPIWLDYGRNLRVGKRFYANFNFTVLDICPVTIGDDVMIGPNASIVSAMHPLLYEERNVTPDARGRMTDQEYGKPITIGNNCWIASNVTICGGVTIGDGCVIGAGSVVTRDIPPGSLAAGNPCRVIRKITEADSVKNKPELY